MKYFIVMSLYILLICPLMVTVIFLMGETIKMDYGLVYVVLIAPVAIMYGAHQMHSRLIGTSLSDR